MGPYLCLGICSDMPQVEILRNESANIVNFKIVNILPPPLNGYGMGQVENSEISEMSEISENYLRVIHLRVFVLALYA